MPVWKLGMEIAIIVFDMTSTLPRNEDYGLTSQIRRAAVSITANFAEGFGRESGPDKRKFYITARGSAFETQSHLEYGKSVGYFDPDQVHHLKKLIDQLIHDTNKLVKSLNNKPQP
jgi:four helix bundle protein